MGFQVLETVQTKTGGGTRASISYKRAGNAKKRVAPRLTVGIPSAIAASVKIKPEQGFALMLGDGPDAGKARIVPVGAGGVCPRGVRGALSFSFGHVPMLGDDAAEKEFVEVRALNGKDLGGGACRRF